MIREDVQVRVEVEDDHVVLVFPRRMDVFETPWQDAMQLGVVLERACNDVPNRSLIINPVEIQRETEQVKLNTHHLNVVLCFDWTDRIKLNAYSACIVARAIREKAQDLMLQEQKGIFVQHNKQGMIKSVHNTRLNQTQIIPGR